MQKCWGEFCSPDFIFDRINKQWEVEEKKMRDENRMVEMMKRNEGGMEEVKTHGYSRFELQWKCNWEKSNANNIPNMLPFGVKKAKSQLHSCSSCSKNEVIKKD